MNCGGFSINHYKECISLAIDKGYYIIPVRDFTYEKKVILLRHDVDFSLEYAYELANIEYDLGIKSTYYIYLHSPTYNALAPKSMGMIKEMKGMGHEIGLHYDSRYDIEHEDALLAAIQQERVISVSHHFPKSNHFKNYDYLINPNKLKLKYISDSGRNWRQECMCKHIGKEHKLHILTHPEWWFGGNNRTSSLEQLSVRLKETVDRDIKDFQKMLFEYVRDEIRK